MSNSRAINSYTLTVKKAIGKGLLRVDTWRYDPLTRRPEVSTSNQSCSDLVFEASSARARKKSMTRVSTIYVRTKRGVLTAMCNMIKECESEECCICLEQVCANGVSTHCKHVFHNECLKSWMMSDNTKSNACPVCRESLKYNADATRKAVSCSNALVGCSNAIECRTVAGCHSSISDPEVISTSISDPEVINTSSE